MANIINVCVFRSPPRPCSENPFSGLLREAFINTVRVCFLLPAFSHPYTIIFRGSLWQLSGKFRDGFSFTSQHIIASHAVWTQFINNSGSTANTSISKTTPRSQQAQPTCWIQCEDKLPCDTWFPSLRVIANHSSTRNLDNKTSPLTAHFWGLCINREVENRSTHFPPSNRPRGDCWFLCC